ncbi:MAG: hypothetical protein ACWGNV_11735 [Bacteroidales bacterium]
MRKAIVFFTLSVTVPMLLHGQTSYLNRPDLLERVEECLQYTYNFKFEEARQVQRALALETPEHPAPTFLEALILYWEYFPLTPEKEASSRFVDLMDHTVDLAETYLESNDNYLEGVFFDLFGRAFKAMFWADNGHPGKVIPDLGTMYRQTKEGFNLKDQFSEFYFSTGLYNYYIEAYPEAHPAYKPLVAFMQDGDKALGLQQLNYAINHAVYLKVESILFMSLIQLKYEKDLNTAFLYAERLNKSYPRNIYYQGHLITILLYLNRFPQVKQVLASMEGQHDDYSEMIRCMANAFMEEEKAGNKHMAERDFERTIAYARDFGSFTDSFTAIGYMGLSRIAASRGNGREAEDYARKASRYTNYSFIIGE